mgnify:CR=1 FL=1
MCGYWSHASLRTLAVILWKHGARRILLDQEIKNSVKTYMKDLRPDTLTVVEKLDIKEFRKSRQINGMFSVFARGKLQKTLLSTLNWKGYDFLEVVQDFTSQVCPVCQNLDPKNREHKTFFCTCCGYENDADHVGLHQATSPCSYQQPLPSR